MRHREVVLKFALAFGAITLALVASTRLARASADVEFVGSTPCDALPRQFLAVPAGASCERISWELRLSPRGSAANGTYHLAAVFGMQAVNDPGFVQGGTSVRLEGSWTALQPGSHGPVYRLTTGDRARTLDFVRLSENLLHPLNERQALMIGNAGWSYTLSRKAGSRPPSTVSDTRAPDSSGTSGSALRGSTLTGVFEGRTPCQELAPVLNFAASRECTKMKWRLTLTPAGYKLETAAYRPVPRTGTWTIDRTPERHVLRLDPTPDGAFLSFLVAEGNLLFFLDGRKDFMVGDAYYSYTLNRTK